MASQLDTLFHQLRSVMAAYAGALRLTTDRPGTFHLDTDHVMKNGRPLFFGAARLGKNKVSYHLMPVYVSPALLDGLSTGLRKRIHGKSCFNFRTLDTETCEEPRTITRLGFEDYVRRGYVARDRGPAR